MANIEDKSFAYTVVRRIVKVLVEAYFDKIVVTGGENIPEGKPVILAPNHQNGLPDPLLFVVWRNLQTVWLARGDIFNKVTSPILRFFKIMPIFRKRDGLSNVQRSAQTFETGSRILRNNRMFGLFPEAGHSPRRQLLSIKKGVPRVIEKTFEDSDYNADIQIVPAGIYYDNYFNYKHDVVINIGKPIPAQKYVELFKKSKFEANKAIQEDIREALEKLAMHIPSEENYQLYEDIRETIRPSIAEKADVSTYNPLTRFNIDKGTIRAINQLEESEKPELRKTFDEIKEKNDAYRSLLKEHNLRDENIVINKKKRPKLIIHCIVLLLSLPFFLFGAITHYIPFRVPDRIVRKKIKDPQLWMTFNLVLAIIIFPLLWLVLGVVASFFLSGTYLLGTVILIVLSGDFAFSWYKSFKKVKAHFKAEKLRKNTPEIFRRKSELLDLLLPIFKISVK
jgi:1-acyl-sn-glycerol-3-phosphate acyltransferase